MNEERTTSRKTRVGKVVSDKMDKTVVDGVAEELAKEGYAQESIDKYLGLFKLLEEKKDVAEGVAFLADTLGEYLDAEVVTNMTEIAMSTTRS